MRRSWKQPVILDTGPLVALLNRGDQFHGWAKTQFGMLTPPVLTCEAVIAEAWHLLRHLPVGQQAIFKVDSTRSHRSEVRITGGTPCGHEAYRPLR